MQSFIVPVFWQDMRRGRTRERLCAGRRAMPRCDAAESSVVKTTYPWLRDSEAYKETYARSVQSPDDFWSEVAEDFTWQGVDKGAEKMKPILEYNFDVREGPVYVKYLENRLTNICYNALDRWVERGYRERVSFFCEGNESDERSIVTYGEMYELVQRFANVLKGFNVGKRDVVVLYLPMVKELPAAMLACARIGAMHSVVFAGFSAEALAGRIVDSNAKVVVSADCVKRARKVVPLKSIADEAIDIAKSKGHEVQHHVVVDAGMGNGAENVMARNGRDVAWDTLVNKASAECPVEWVPSEHPLFVLYTSGSTGRPKGVVHGTGGYMVYSAITFKYSFDYHFEDDIFFSTSDCGWITGHSYVVYGPMLNGASQVLHAGVPSYPDAGRLWEIVERYKVTQLYTAPTVLRSLKGASGPFDNAEENSAHWVKRYNRDSLRVLGTVGEPIDAATWTWYHNVVGDGRCHISDTYWQTETGGHVITPLPNAGKDAHLMNKAGSAMYPFFGISPVLLDQNGQVQHGEAEGFLAFERAWPGALRTILGDHSRMEETYFARFPGYYFTGDAAKRDVDGDIWITGRVDDVVNVSGHRLGTAEVEAAITAHAAVVEAAVVAVPHEVKGESLYAFVAIRDECTWNDGLRGEIRNKVRTAIGPIATPDTVQNARALPKTRSGKLMRRILRKIATQGKEVDVHALGDTSTLTDPSVVGELIAGYGK